MTFRHIQRPAVVYRITPVAVVGDTTHVCFEAAQNRWNCTACWDIFPTASALFEHACIAYCHYCASRLYEGHGWQHFCPRLYGHQQLMEHMEEESFMVHDSVMLEGASRVVTFVPRRRYVDLRHYFQDF